MIPKLRSPIVFVHGLLGFDRLQLAGYTLASYFAGIPYEVAAVGNRTLVASLSPTGGVAQRAAELKRFLLRETNGEPVHLFAHSMGGLDARYMISCLGMADRVLSLTTIGTPHHGTAFADWGIHRLERLLKPIFDLCAIPKQAFYDLTTMRCRELNEQAPDAPRVRYFSVAGTCERSWLAPEWLWPHTIISEVEGPNDGIVSVASATYGESTEVWDGDHLSLINWPNPVAQARGIWQDRMPRFAAMVQRLADQGF
jgi:triacylglycerol lipase